MARRKNKNNAEETESTACMVRRKIENYLELKRLQDEIGFGDVDLVIE